MKDKAKTQKQLIADLQELRQQLAEGDDLYAGDHRLQSRYRDRIQ